MENLKIREEIEKAIMEGPSFGMSDFQIKTFNIGNHVMKGRSYRQVLLELNDKFMALKKNEIGRKRIKIQISMLEKKIAKEKDKDKKELLQCDLEEKQLDIDNQSKLILDAMNACTTIYNEFKNLPKFTAEEFEKQEKEYWTRRIMRDAELDTIATGRISAGTASSLERLGFNPVQVQVEILVLHDKTIQKSLGEIKKAAELENKTNNQPVLENKGENNA